MTTAELIGRAGTAYLQTKVGAGNHEAGVARLLLDRLTGPQVAAICRTIVASPHLADDILIRIPRQLGEPQGLPENLLTDERTTHWRHADCDRSAILLANTDDDQGQSLRDVTPIDSGVLCSEPDLWVDQAAEGLGLTDRELTIWKRALKGLLDAKPVSLDTFASYILATRQAREEHGQPLVMALGWALPELQVPRHSALFNAIREQSLTHASQWKRLYQQAFNRYGPYLRKLSPSQQPLTQDQLREAWENVKADVPPQHHATVEAFIEAPNKWNDEAAALSRLEWEQDNIRSLFDGLRAKKVPLGTETADFFEDTFPDALTDEEREYLQRLDSRNTREANEEDEEFYEHHRTELSRSRSLKAKWDKFIFGQPIETTDFLVGILRALERLFEQAGPGAQGRKLFIESHRQNRAELREMNTDAVMYFSRRYRGIHELTRRDVTWEVGELFSYERVIDRDRQRGRYQPTKSTAKAANQIKFYVRMETQSGGGQTYATQLIWSFNANGICSQMADDWDRLLEHPFMLTRVTREPVSKKGKLQAIDLADVNTFEPIFRQERGSLVPRYERSKDLSILFPERLDSALRNRRIGSDGHAGLKAAWDAFKQAYSEAMRAAYEEGASAPICLNIEGTYGNLLEALLRHAPGDSNRRDLWEPVILFGAVPVDGGAPAAIVAPWHPLRLLATAVKTRQLAGLIRHLVKAETVDFGDARVFFRDVSEEMQHPYYPEVCVGMSGSEPLLLTQTDTNGDYTLMESPINTAGEDDATNENPVRLANC